MLNLRAIVRPAIKAVNNDQLILWLASTGPSLNVSTGVVTPTYAPAQTIWAQIQPVPSDRLAHLEQLNITGILRQVYMRGAVATAVREDGTGGDLLQFPETPNGPQRTWLVVQVPEQWSDWCKVIAKLQADQSNTSVWGNAPTY